MRLFGLACVIAGFAACASDSSGGGGPNAPSSFSVTVMDGAAHLTWKDNSTDETAFVIERAGPGASFVEVGREAFNIETYHDATVASGVTYRYRLAAENAAGM